MIDYSLTKFNTISEYTAFTKSANFKQPNVSWINGTSNVFFNPYIPQSIEICLSKDGSYYSVSVKDFKEQYSNLSNSGFSIEGPIVIPASHMKDGKARVISVHSMDTSSPETGSNTNKAIVWGGIARTIATDTPTYTYTGVDISELRNYTGVAKIDNIEGETTIGSLDYAYLPSDKFKTNGIQSVLDPLAYYNNTVDPMRYAPSPYLKNERKNYLYSNSTVNNALSDFDGLGNTNIITSYVTGQTDWLTASTITVPENTATSVGDVWDLRGYYPAACCCSRYKTSGIGKGSWYLPACGELGYILPRFNEINAALAAIIEKNPSLGAVQLGASRICWSSSEYLSTYARCVYASNGYVYGYTKSHAGYVRAFASVSLSPLCF